MRTFSSVVPTLGVLGGAGPLVAAAFVHAFLQRYQALTGVRLDGDFPGVVALNRAIAGIGPQGVEDAELARQDLEKLAHQATAAGANALLVPCASAQPFLPQNTSVPTVRWVEAAAAAFRREGFRSIGLIGSRSARAQGVFRAALAAHGLAAVELPAVLQARADALIAQGMTGRFLPRHRSALEVCQSTLKTAGGQAIWWGCTELAFLPSQWAQGPTLGPMDAMVGAVLEHLDIAPLRVSTLSTGLAAA